MKVYEKRCYATTIHSNNEHAAARRRHPSLRLAENARNCDCWWWQRSYSSSLLGFLIVVGPLLASALVTMVGTDGPESVVNLLLLVSLGDGGEFDLVNLLDNGHGDASDLVGSGGGLELLGGGVVDLTLLRLVLASGEDNELALVGVESGDVHLEHLFAGGSSAVIN